MSKIENCPLCNGTNIEKMEKAYICKDCGLGIPQIDTPLLMKDFFKLTFETVLLFKSINPEADANKLTDIVMNFLHKQQKHPVRPDGYCEFCEKVIK